METRICQGFMISDWCSMIPSGKWIMSKYGLSNGPVVFASLAGKLCVLPVWQPHFTRGVNKGRKAESLTAKQNLRGLHPLNLALRTFFVMVIWVGKSSSKWTWGVMPKKHPCDFRILRKISPIQLLGYL